MVLVDSEGEFNTVVFGAGIGAFIGGGIALIQGKSAQEVFSAAVGGMVTGAIVGSGAGLLGTIGTGAAGNVAGQLTERALLGQPSTLQQAGTDAVVGGVGGGLGYGVGKYAIEPITNKLIQSASEQSVVNVTNSISDEALVVRGGGRSNQAPDKFRIGPSRTPGVNGYSVQCSNSCTDISQIGQLGQHLPNSEISVVKARNIRAVDGDVKATPGGGYHATVTGLGGNTSSKLPWQVVKNPKPLKK